MRDVLIRPWLCISGQKNVPIDVQTMQAAVDSVSRSNLIGNLNLARRENQKENWILLERVKSGYHRESLY